MAINKFAESVINGTYKKREEENNAQQPTQPTQTIQPTQTTQVTQPTIKNSFADSVINGTYESNKFKSDNFFKSSPAEFGGNKKEEDEDEDDGYQFGDFTRGLLDLGGDLVSGAIDIGGKTVGTVVDVGGNLLHGGLQALEGGADALQYIGADINDFLGRSEEAEKLRQNARFNSVGALFGENKPNETIVQQNILEELDKNSWAPEIIDDIANGAGGVAMNAALATVSGGSTLATNASIFATSYGDAMSNALNNGASVNDARLTALLDATASTVAENAFNSKFGLKTSGYAEKLLKGKVSNAINNVMKSSRGKALLSVIKDGLEEGSEEVIESMVGNLTKSLSYNITDLLSNVNPDIKFEYGRNEVSKDFIGEFLKPLTQKETLERFVMASLTSAVYNVGANAISNRINNNAQEEPQMEQPLEQTQMPQIEQEQQNSINNQPTIEQPQIELKQAENEAIQNNTKNTEQDELSKWDGNINSILENDAKVDELFGNNNELFTDTKNNLDEVKQQSIVDDSNTFNLGKNEQITNQETKQQPIQETTQEQKATPEINQNLAETKSEDVIQAKLTPQQEEKHFIDSGVDPKVAKILSEMPKPDKKSFSEKVKDGKATMREEWNYFKRNFVDKGETIYRLAKKLKNKKLYATYDKMGTTRGEANYSIDKAQTNLTGKQYDNFIDKNGKKTSMSLNQIWEGVDQKAANEYLAHWLNIDRYNQQTEDGQNKYVFGTPDITPEISQQRISELEATNPELKRFGENVWQYGKNMLQNMVESGLVNEQQAQQFMKETPHYVRLQRNVDTNTKTSIDFDKNGKAVVNKPTKNEFKGSNIDILPFKNSMAEYTFDVAKAMRTNIFAQELAKSMSVSSTDNSITSLDDSFGVRPDLLQDNGDGTYSLTLFNNGVATVIPIDEGIYESLTPNKHYKWEDRLAFKGIRKIDSFRKALLTEKNPMFLATNMMKDLFDAPLNSKYPVEFAKNYPRAIKEVATNGKYYQQYQALGGLQNSYFEKGEFKKQGSKANPLTWIEKGNNAIEQFPRLAEFISTMEKTGDVNQAMYNAAEITTNFKRGGDVAKAANRNGATFLNASIQGFDKQIRNFSDIFSKSNGKLNIDKRQAVQLLGKIVVLGIAPALINDMMYGDDEEYQNMQDYIKDRYYLFKGLNGQWIRIPKGRAVSVFQSAARRTGEAIEGDENAFKGFANFASTQVAPNNPFENNILSPLIDVARNESWSGNKIVSDSMSKRPEAEQWNEKTDEFSKWLGGVLNVSPMKINYLIDQYSGAIGDVLLPMNTAKSTSATSNPILQPFADKFTTDAVYSDKNVSVFYDTERELEKKKNSSSATEEDKIKYKYLYNQGLQMSELRKEQSKIQSDSSLSKSEKYDKAREIQKQINELSKNAVKELENFKDNKYYATIGDSVYYLDADGTFKKDAYADSHKKSAEKKGMALYDYYKEQYEKRKEKANNGNN